MNKMCNLCQKTVCNPIIRFIFRLGFGKWSCDHVYIHKQRITLPFSRKQMCNVLYTDVDMVTWLLAWIPLCSIFPTDLIICLLGMGKGVSNLCGRLRLLFSKLTDFLNALFWHGHHYISLLDCQNLSSDSLFRYSPCFLGKEVWHIISEKGFSHLFLQPFQVAVQTYHSQLHIYLQLFTQFTNNCFTKSYTRCVPQYTF